jgi:hypothetical protein
MNAQSFFGIFVLGSRSRLAQTLKAVKDRGSGGGVSGAASPPIPTTRQLTGFDVDFCARGGVERLGQVKFTLLPARTV